MCCGNVLICSKLRRATCVRNEALAAKFVRGQSLSGLRARWLNNVRFQAIATGVCATITGALSCPSFCSRIRWFLWDLQLDASEGKAYIHVLIYIQGHA